MQCAAAPRCASVASETNVPLYIGIFYPNSIRFMQRHSHGGFVQVTWSGWYRVVNNESALSIPARDVGLSGARTLLSFEYLGHFCRKRILITSRNIYFNVYKLEAIRSDCMETAAGLWSICMTRES
jgi:hypothetical protein